MTGARRALLTGLALACRLGDPLFAQSSASYVVAPSALNSGGNPIGGTVLQSASYRITLDAIGDAIAPTAMVSTSYSLGGGSPASQRPPGEVLGLRFPSKTTLTWSVELSAGSYNLYRGPLNGIVSSGFGSCLQHGLPATSASDSDPVLPSSGFFYLVTVSNLVGEEGTKGTSSNNVERPNNAPCP